MTEDIEEEDSPDSGVREPRKPVSPNKSGAAVAVPEEQEDLELVGT